MDVQLFSATLILSFPYEWKLDVYHALHILHISYITYFIYSDN